MKKAIIYCFSGTGNTKRVSDLVAQNLKDYGIETEVFSVDRKNYKERSYKNPNDYDVVGVSYPIYGFNAPYLVNRFVKSLPKAKANQQAFIIKTSGEPFRFNNSSSNAIKRYFKHKKYQLTYEKHYLMPYNIMFRYNEGLVKQMALYSEELSKVSAKKIAEKTPEKLKITFLSLVANFICKLVWLSPLLGKGFKVHKDKCISCGKCVKNCPTQNIIVKENGKYKFLSNCMLCCRCVMNCPTDAITTGIMNSWKVNSPYPFERVLKDESISANFINKDTKGYFKKFRRYYDTIDKELKEYGIVPPREKFAPNEYALMTKKQRKQYNKAKSNQK